MPHRDSLLGHYLAALVVNASTVDKCSGDILQSALPLPPTYLASNRSTTGSCENILGHVTIRATQNVPQSLRMWRLGAAQLECTVRKVRKRLYRGLSSVRTSAKAACQHSPRAK